MFEIAYDAVAGLLLGTCSRAFSVEDVERHASLATAALAQCRAEHGDVKILIFIDTAVQDGEVMRAAQTQRARILTGPHDRLAFVFATSLAKSQMGPFFESEREKAFVSENAAMTWLLADRGRARQAA